MNCSLAIFKNPFYIEYRIFSPLLWTGKLRWTEGSICSFPETVQTWKQSTKRVWFPELLELAAVIKFDRSLWILWTPWIHVLSNFLVCLTMDESSHEQFNSAELEFTALMLDSAPALEQTLITPICTHVLGAKRVPTLEFSTQEAEFHLMYHPI